jgi:hypothetical protein
LKAFKDAEKVWIDSCLTISLKRRKQAYDMATVLLDSGLFNKKVGRSQLREQIMRFYNGPSTPGESYTTPEEKWLDEQEKTAHDAMVSKNIMEYRDKAVCWLIAKGKSYGKDFTADTAVSVADEIAYKEEVSRRADPVLVDNWHDFYGNNCDGPCKGWNGVGHRCQCGNRRVSWTQDYGHTFEHPAVVAEAY